MIEQINELFDDQELVYKIRERLPKFFHQVELENSRAGKITMEVGTARERVITALLIYKFGERHVNSEVPAVESEVDVYLYDNPISIKSITGSGFAGVKLIWTVDRQSVLIFAENYQPHADMILVRINWANTGGLYYIPLEVQSAVLTILGNNKYIKIPKEGTNPRGAEISKVAMTMLLTHPETKCIEINWKKETVEFNAYNRWVELWQME